MRNGVLAVGVLAVVLVGCGNGATTTTDSSKPATSSTTATSTSKPTATNRTAASEKPVSKPSAVPGSGAPNGSASAGPDGPWGNNGGTNTTGFENPETLGKAMVAALNDPSKLPSLFPADSVLDASFSCKEWGSFYGAVRFSIDALVHDLKDTKGPFEFVRAAPSGQSKTLSKGQEGDGCVMKEDVEMTTWSLTYKMAGKEKEIGVDMIKLGGKWYPIGFS